MGYEINKSVTQSIDNSWGLNFIKANTVLSYILQPKLAYPNKLSIIHLFIQLGSGFQFGLAGLVIGIGIQNNET